LGNFHIVQGAIAQLKFPLARLDEAALKIFA
jgi:hypothetical protein